jgi:uncharacterized protein (DUF4415 family)
MRKNASRPDPENPEWTAKEIRSARPLIDVLPEETAAAVRRYRGQRGPQKAPTKELISPRVDREWRPTDRADRGGKHARMKL